MSGGPGDATGGERSGDEFPEQPDQLLLTEIPDDARELAAEVATYQRELRAARRRALANRLLPLERLRRYGIAAPVIIAVLCSAIAVTALFFALRPDGAASVRQEPLATQPAAQVGSVGGLIPATPLLVGTVTRSAQSLRPGVLALVPIDCGCFAVVENLARQAGQFGFRLYVVAPSGIDTEVDAIASKVRGAQVTSAFDAVGALAQTYHATGVTAVLLRGNGVVQDVVRDLSASTRLTARIASLAE
ncbi:MAG: hypothetical protein QOG53_1821 [Frankiales bacterium]|jgi:hypothetical protein|nr:hypothetical protein [Frankiales bacterium]